jgi:hypothetical protein
MFNLQAQISLCDGSFASDSVAALATFRFWDIAQYLLDM